MLTRTVGPIQPLTQNSTSELLSAFRRNTDLPLDLGHSRRQDCGKVAGWSVPCTPGHANQDPDCVKCPPAEASTVEFYPWTINNLAGCNEPWNPDEWQTIADATVADGTGCAISQELATGSYSGSPSLQSEAIDLTGAGAAHPVNALSALLNAFRVTGHGRPVIHIPLFAIPVFEEAGVIRWTAGGYRGPGNISINAGSCLPGVGPDATGNIDNTATGEIYIYATGPLEFNVGPITAYDPNGVQVNYQTNSVIAESRRRAVVSFETCRVFGVRVCGLHPTSCPGTVAIDEVPFQAPKQSEVADVPAELKPQEVAKPEAAIASEIAAADAERAMADSQRAIRAVISDDPTPEGVAPKGTVSELLALVDGDKDMAQLVLEEELNSPSPRKTLIEALEEITNG